MWLVHLRVSDKTSFAVELTAHDERSFRLAIRRAMFEYRAHFLPPPGQPMRYDRPIPEPDLQIKNPRTGEWVSASYGCPSGRRSYCLPTDVVELTCHAQEHWKRVLEALECMNWFNRMFGNVSRRLLSAGEPMKRHLRVVQPVRKETDT
ncbi:MAG: hypothetical protein AB1733_15865 [Thermodesulfobacteriota bacterium]